MITLEKIIKDNPKTYYYKEFSNSPIMAIVFRGAGKGNGDFEFYKTFNSLDINSLIISFQGNNEWYTQGLEGLGNNVEELLKNFTELLPTYLLSKKIKEVVVIGPSMGGFVALLFGHFIKQQLRNLGIKLRILCLGVETTLFLKGSNSSFHNSKHNFASKIPNYLLDINSLEYYADEICLYFGEYFIPDCYSALKFKEIQKLKYNFNVKTLSISDCPHGIAFYVNQNRGFIVDFFKEFIINNSYFILHQGAMSNYLSYKDLEPLFTLNIEEKGAEKYLKHLLSKYFNFGLALNRMGVWCEKNDQILEAYKYLYLSKKIKADHENTNIHFDSVVKIINKQKESKK